MTPRHFAWQAWRLVTSTFVLRGRRCAWSHPPSFRVAGVALRALGWLWWRAWTGLVTGDAAALWLWWRAWTGSVAGDAAALCVAGVALGDIHLRFTWQEWHLVTSTFVLRGRRGTYHTPYFTDHFVTHHLSHTIFGTPSFKTLSHTIFVANHLSHCIFQAPSFTPNFATHHL